MRKQLTAPLIEREPTPLTGRKEINDTIIPQLALRITSDGTRSFALRTRINEKQVRITIGDARVLKLVDARQEASDILKKCKAGIDPREEKRIERVTAEKEDALRFSVVADQFIERYCKKRTRGWKQTKSTLDRDFIPRWKNRLLTEINRDDIAAALDAIEDRASFVRANRALAVIRKLFNWAVAERGMLAISPIVIGMSRGKESSRDRFLSFSEIRLVWQAAETLSEPFGALVKMLLVTGQRRGEVATMAIDALDTGHGRTWTLTPSETKAKRAHAVPLSDLALEILASVTLIKDCPYVFSTTGKTPVSGFGKTKEHLNARILELIRNQSAATGRDSEKVEPLPEWRFHDLRRTAATHMGDILGFAPHVIGSVLNHDPKKYMGITHVYARSDLIAERRAALSAWARFVQLLVDDAKWTAVEAHLRANPAEDTESSYERREELRRMIRADAKTWRLYVASLSERAGDNVITLRLTPPIS